ncbi:hypothetical protein Celaphus_00005137, partial [Cervus elaphus hippelaphus]
MCKSPAGFSPGMSVPGPLIPLCAPFPPTGALEIGQALPIHTGRYTCTARNAAGMAHKHVVLTVRGERPRAGQLWPWRQGSRWRARGFSGRKDSACLCPPFRGFRKPLFPLEASVSGAQTPLGWRCPQGPLPPCSFAASPVVKPLPSVVWAVAKEEVLLPCEASGLPRPSITWQKEGLSVPAGAGTQVLPSGQLRIIHVSPEDAGNYFCLAQNSAGSAVGKTRLVVQVPPAIKTGLPNLSITEGAHALLPCTASGSPEPNITWEKDGQPVSGAEGKFTIQPSGELLVKNSEVRAWPQGAEGDDSDGGSSRHRVSWSVLNPAPLLNPRTWG